MDVTICSLVESTVRYFTLIFASLNGIHFHSKRNNRVGRSIKAGEKTQSEASIDLRPIDTVAKLT